jgi:hypothetical protein
VRYFDGLLSATVGKFGIGLFLAKEFEVDNTEKEVAELEKSLWEKEKPVDDNIVDERADSIIRAVNDIKAAELLKDNARVLVLCDSILEILSPEMVLSEEKL